MYLYNSATHKKAEFLTHTPGRVEMYTCGPTVYHFAHIGNLRSYIMEDVLEKALRYEGYNVNRVMNITDVGHLSSDADTGEDKMVKGAKREHKTVMEIAQYYTDAFFADCKKLNIKRPDVVQPATGCIDEYIKIIAKLMDTGYAYFAGGNVYFDTSRLDHYYVFNDHDEDDLAVGVREGVEEDTNKRNKNDFVLWFTKSKFENQSGALSAATLDRAANAITYRVFGCEEDRKAAYEKNLSAYENAAVRANIWNTAMPPIYRIISMASILFILYFGGRNVLHEGWTPWTIAVFTTFLSCYTKLATKSSSAAKLFNAVHKAQVSWKRIKPLLQNSEAEPELPAAAPAKLSVDHLHFAYPNGKEIIHDLSFEAAPGQIIGVTGPVACGKSTLGKTFLCESPYEGSITFGGKELGKMEKTDRNCIIGYLGHDPELFHGSVEDNIRLGGKQGAEEMIRIVCFEEETKAMEDGIHTLVGTSGVRLSGGQAQRLALARTLYHKRPVLVLDDPFSALDKKTEAQIFANVKELARDSIVILISHRLYLFDQMDQVIWMDEGHTKVGTHEELRAEVPSYAELCRDQTKGGSNDEK